MRLLAVAVAIGSAMLLATLARSAEAPAKDADDIRARLKAYAEVKLRADLSALAPRERDALARIVTAVNAMDAVYWKQMGRQALEARQAFAKAADPVDLLYQRFIEINYGPFDIRKDMERFVEGGAAGPRQPGAGFYPEDMTKEEFEAHLKSHPEAREEFERLNTLVRRIDGTLVAIPFEKVYVDELQTAS